MDYAGLGALFEGAASGIETGARLGFLAQQTHAQRELKTVEAKKAAMEAEKTKQEIGLAKIGKITDMYKEAPDSLKPEIFKTWAGQVNTLYGTDIDPNSVATNGSYLDDFGKLIKGKEKGLYGDDDFLYLAGQLRSKMDKDSSAQAGSILADLPAAIDAKAKKEKTITPEDAAKRITELTKMFADVGKRSEMEAMAIAQDPTNAKLFGSVSPADKAAVKARVLSEIELMNKRLPAEQQIKQVTKAQYDIIKKSAETKLGRPVSDAELMKRLIITDDNAIAQP